MREVKPLRKIKIEEKKLILIKNINDKLEVTMKVKSKYELYYGKLGNNVYKSDTYNAKVIIEVEAKDK